jgi:hypothetical protein
MCVHVFQYPCLESVRLHHVGDMEPRESDRIVGEQGRTDICFAIVVADEERSEVVAPSLQIGLYGEGCSLGEVDDAELASLTAYGEFERLMVHILTVQRCELRYTQTCRIDTLRYRIVSFSLDSLSWYRREVALDLLAREECHLSVLHSHEVECGRIEAVDLFLLEILEPRSDRDNMSIDRLSCQP